MRAGAREGGKTEQIGGRKRKNVNREETILVSNLDAEDVYGKSRDVEKHAR